MRVDEHQDENARRSTVFPVARVRAGNAVPRGVIVVLVVAVVVFLAGIQVGAGSAAAPASPRSMAGSAEALSLYRGALGAWRDLGLAWDEALTAIDMASLLDPGEPEVRVAADRARDILAGLGARPFR